MTAAQAKKLTKAAPENRDISKLMSVIYRQVEAAAKAGNSQVTVDFGRTAFKTGDWDAIKKRLKTEGYNYSTRSNAGQLAVDLTVKW